ncbi:MAG: cysteine desulfurase [bacterium]|nr:cysteine desulfurase [bacterium]
MNREDFPMLKNNIIYFDNGATTFKPQSVIDKTVSYYSSYSSNAHRGDYDISLIVDKEYEGVREKVRRFINADSTSEIVFTKGTTESLNMIVFGFMKYNLQKGDEVLLSKSEHASNILPWLELESEIGIVIKYIPLNEKLELTFDNLKSAVSKKTKVISLAHITNTIGDVRPVVEIGKFCKENNIYFVLDGAQSVPHLKTDVKELNCDFLAFSAHKMLGPTGIGVLYGRYELLDKLKPLVLGGGMNSSFTDNSYELKTLPTRLEAGTQNIAGVVGLGEAISYLEKIGMDKIHNHEVDLKKYLTEKLSNISNVKVYNKNTISGTVLFNLDNVFAQDTAIYLNKHNICVRAGNHCAKILKDELGIKNTCRISLYFYNTKEEIDELVKVLENSYNIFKEVI